jgi:hypothetical protein
MLDKYHTPLNIVADDIRNKLTYDLGQNVVYSHWKNWRMLSLRCSLRTHECGLETRLQRQCTFENQGVSSHSEATKR